MGTLLSIFPLWLVGLWLLGCIGLCVHVYRTGREFFWMWIILLFQPIGAVVYVAAVILPELLRGPAVRKIGAETRAALDPTREYREAQKACDDTPTVRNQSRLAAAAAALGRHDEAERLYAEAAQGIHAEDPALLLGRANALLELGRGAEALPVLERIDPAENTAAISLAFGRAYEAVGRVDEAEARLSEAVVRLPGFEALGRQAAFLARQGRRDEARAIIADMDKRLTKTTPQFRKEGRHWRDLAAKALAEG